MMEGVIILSMTVSTREKPGANGWDELARLTHPRELHHLLLTEAADGHLPSSIIPALVTL